MKKSHHRGFTLIELLVVIAIIGLLSSVVLASLNTARNKAKDAAIREGVRQYSTLMALEYSETGVYTGLQPQTWVSTAAGCNALALTGNYAANAKAICVNIVANSTGGLGMYLGNSADNVNKFAIMAYLPGKGTMYCRGSGGGSSDTEPANGSGGWAAVGCYSNP